MPVKTDPPAKEDVAKAAFEHIKKAYAGRLAKNDPFVVFPSDVARHVGFFGYMFMAVTRLVRTSFDELGWNVIEYGLYLDGNSAQKIYWQFVRKPKFEG